MKVSLSPKLPSSADILLVLVPEKFTKKDFGKLFDTKLQKEIDTQKKNNAFGGRLGESVLITLPSRGMKRCYLVGSGKMKERLNVRKAAINAIKIAKKVKAANVVLLLADSSCARRTISGVIVGDYEFKIGDTKERFNPKKATIVSTRKVEKKVVESEIALGESMNLARDLVDMPPNFMTPKLLAAEAKKLGKGLGNKIKVKVLGEKEMKKLGMGSLLGVGQGSVEESRFIILEYRGGSAKEKPIAFVGKGVCFDSGGYNLKPTGHIEDMKTDMAGAATVLGLFKWIAATRPKKNLVGVIGAVENMVSHHAYKPGDVITAMNGQTIEVTNTDAEGRLVLCDCLYYTATKLKPACMIDIATLTGGVIAALGYDITGIMGTDQKLVDNVLKHSERADEDLWQLPLNDKLKEKTKGSISDLENHTAGCGMSSSMGGAFLNNFVEDVPWVHLDIAGTAYHGKYGNGLLPKGATAVLLRTLRHFVEES